MQPKKVQSNTNAAADFGGLLRHQAWVGGKWVDAAKKAKFEVFNPANGENIGSVPDMGAGETEAAIAAAKKAFPAWRATTAKERGKILRKMVRPDHGECRAAGAAADGGAGQAAVRSARRNHRGRCVRRMVRRGSAPRLRRHDPDAQGRCAVSRDERTCWRVRRDYAVELPERDDHAQGGARAGRRLYRRSETGGRYAVLSIGAGGAGGTGRVSRRNSQHHYRHEKIRARHRQNADRKQRCAQDVLHGLD